jgi:hypothetical protein
VKNHVDSVAAIGQKVFNPDPAGNDQGSGMMILRESGKVERTEKLIRGYGNTDNIVPLFKDDPVGRPTDILVMNFYVVTRRRESSNRSYGMRGKQRPGEKIGDAPGDLPVNIVLIARTYKQYFFVPHYEWYVYREIGLKMMPCQGTGIERQDMIFLIYGVYSAIAGE